MLKQTLVTGLVAVICCTAFAPVANAQVALPPHLSFPDAKSEWGCTFTKKCPSTATTSSAEPDE